MEQPTQDDNDEQKLLTRQEQWCKAWQEAEKQFHKKEFLEWFSKLSDETKEELNFNTEKYSKVEHYYNATQNEDPPDPNDKDVCCFCFETILLGIKKPRIKLKCNHQYHFEGIESWWQKSKMSSL